MSIDPSSFYSYNITDTCAVWNILSSRTLYSSARTAGVSFFCTRFVLYECLVKPRKKLRTTDAELQKRLKSAQEHNDFSAYNLDITDLQTVNILENRKRLGKGELSSIAFAMKTQQAFLTDDQKARKLAREVLPIALIQTTPHLLGWLFFKMHLSDGDKDTIIGEHKEMMCPLAMYFEEMYAEACRCRLMANQKDQCNE
jgi:hypothetical protein